ncbi:hypothetical protein N9901_01020 [Flavobacteriaceae bacterium]|nr:hypothetical protein [Flavobacteriaceae bacterium]
MKNKKNIFTVLILLFTVHFSVTAQQEFIETYSSGEKIIEDTEDEKFEKLVETENLEREDQAIKEAHDTYSVFKDFRIPVRDNVNQTDLLNAGWQTEPNHYTFRCRDKKRIRLTYWTLASGTEEVKGSDFVNITSTEDDCLKTDLFYKK